MLVASTMKQGWWMIQIGKEFHLERYKCAFSFVCYRASNNHVIDIPVMGKLTRYVAKPRPVTMPTYVARYCTVYTPQEMRETSTSKPLAL